MENNTGNIQINLFNQLSRILPATVSMADEIAEALDVSIDSAYRRLRGETPLDIYEIEMLCKRYKLSFDSLFDVTGNAVTFDFGLMGDELNYKAYLQSILADMQNILKSRNGKIIYAGQDIPLFHNFGFPLLAKFKFFYWLKSVMNVPSFQGLKFDASLVIEDIYHLGLEIYNVYAKIPSVEIWTEITPISLFKQIEFFWDSGIFQSKDDAIAVCDEVKEAFLIIEKQAALSKKYDSKGNIVSDENAFLFYWSEIEIGNNCILVETNGEKKSYLTFNTFNKLSTRNKLFCNETERWLKNLIRKSILISDVSEKQRYQFFKMINEGLEQTKNKIINN